MIKREERPAVKTPISNEIRRSFLNRSILRFDRKLRRLPCGNLRRGDEIAERTETSFESEAGFLDDLCVESHAGELDEVFPVCARKIDKAHVVVLNHIPAKLEIMRWQPSSVAKTFTVPIGSSPNAILLPARPLTT